MRPPRVRLTVRSENSREIVRALRPVRVTWCAMLASMVAFFALPGLIDELRRTLEENPARPVYFEVTQIAPGDFQLGARAYAMWAACAICLALAAVVPRLLHGRALGRLRLLGAERVVVPGAYRAPPDRSFVVTRGGLARLQAAYHARLGMMLLLLWPALVISTVDAAVPIRWWSTVMGCGLVFAGVHEYLPTFVIATLLLLASAPTPRRVLGPFAEGFERGTLAPPPR